MKVRSGVGGGDNLRYVMGVKEWGVNDVEVELWE